MIPGGLRVNRGLAKIGGEFWIVLLVRLSTPTDIYRYQQYSSISTPILTIFKQ